MQSAKLSVGNQIEARCTKCRKNRKHTIITITEENPAQVQCGACDRQHKFRPPTPAKKVVRRQTKNEDERNEWALLRPEMNIAKATEYSMTMKYKVRALINHPIFGLGVVQRIAGAQKVEVLFEDGKKTMRCS